MFENIKWKWIIVSGASAFILSMTVGGIRGGIRLPVLLFRGLLFAIFFALLAVGVQIIINKFLPELNEGQSSAANDDSESESSGSFDFVMPGEGYEYKGKQGNPDSEVGAEDAEEVATGDVSAPDDSVSGQTFSSEEADEDAGLEAVGDISSDDSEEAAVEDGGSVSSSSSSGSRDFVNIGETDIPSVQENMAIDSLPDLESYSTVFDDEAANAQNQNQNGKSGGDNGKSGTSYYSHGKNDENVQSFLRSHNEPAEMAKTITTVLKRESNKT